MITRKRPAKSSLFGPVPSRRLGLSLGIDLTIPKTCTLDCVYCQLGKTNCLTATRSQMVPAKSVLSDLQTLSSHLGTSDVDYVTLSGSGEPTLNTDIEAVINAAKRVMSHPVAVITNSTILHDKQVRQALMAADLVIPSLDAADEATFHLVNRPTPEIQFSQVLSGLIAFSQAYNGLLWLEIMLVKGMNDSLEHIARLRQLLTRIKYDKIQLNTPQRPPAEPEAKPLDSAMLDRACSLLGPRCEIIAEFTSSSHYQEMESRQALLNTLSRRPLTLNDITASLGINPNEAVKLIALLRQAELVNVINHNGTRYFAVSANETVPDEDS